ncbi:MAG: ComF family protein [Alphaproteobacteria bacterium]|nr:ComF family protein [Alphaproteobacteria bacterium]
MNVWRRIIDFILPPRCAMCGKILRTDKGICDDCISEIEFLSSPVCYHCGQPLMAVDAVLHSHLLCGECIKPHHRRLFRLSRSAFAYDDFSKKLVLDFKFRDHTELAALLAKILYVAGRDIWELGVDLIVPVPLHYTRLIKRKYNQSSLLAKELGKLTAVKSDNFVLRKIRRTKPQVECSAAQRLVNVKNAFAVRHPERIKGKRVLLIDDVLTTGTTAKECATSLRRAGAKSVDCLTLARVMH